MIPIIGIISLYIIRESKHNMIDIYQKTAKQKMRCEDYVSYKDNCIVLSDGCSSSKDTHLGSLLYSELGTSYFKNHKHKIIKQEWEGFARYCSNNMFLKNNSILDATVIVLNEDEHNIYINMCGDGLYFFKYQEDAFPTYIKVDYESNAPIYPSYLLSKSILNKREKAKEKIIKYRYSSKYDSFIEEFKELEDIDRIGTYNLLNKHELEYVGIASDGIFDFLQNGNSIDIKLVLDHIIGFKGSGEFMKRKMNHMFKCFEKEKIFPHDDFSIGVWKHDN